MRGNVQAAHRSSEQYENNKEFPSNICVEERSFWKIFFVQSLEILITVANIFITQSQ